MAKAAAKAKRRQSSRPAPTPGTERRMWGKPCTYVPGHPIAPDSGWVLTHRLAAYVAAGGGDPICATCHRALDWRAHGREPLAVAVRTLADGERLTMCWPCVAGLGTTTHALELPTLHPLLWAVAGGHYGGPPTVREGAPVTESLDADRDEGEVLAAIRSVALRIEAACTDATEPMLRAAVALIGLRVRQAAS